MTQQDPQQGDQPQQSISRDELTRQVARHREAREKLRRAVAAIHPGKGERCPACNILACDLLDAAEVLIP